MDMRGELGACLSVIVAFEHGAEVWNAVLLQFYA
jgi:hypothetical protein